MQTTPAGSAAFKSRNQTTLTAQSCVSLFPSSSPCSAVLRLSLPSAATTDPEAAVVRRRTPCTVLGRRLATFRPVRPAAALQAPLTCARPNVVSFSNFDRGHLERSAHHDIQNSRGRFHVRAFRASTRIHADGQVIRIRYGIVGGAEG